MYKEKKKYKMLQEVLQGMLQRDNIDIYQFVEMQSGIKQ